MIPTSALWRCLRLLELRPRRVAGAVAAGTAALGSALALAAVAAWLIARAWQMPPVLDLSVAVVAVRALGIGRGIFRYVERLAAHDTAFRGTTAARAAIYRALAAGDPAAVAGRKRGDVLRRTGEDLELVAAVVVRAIVPIAVAATMAVAAVVLLATISLTAAAVLAAGLVVAGVGAPIFAARAAQDAESAGIGARAEYTELTVTALEHAAELRVARRLEHVVADARAASRRAAVATDRVAARGAVAAAATPWAIGISVVVAAVVGILGTGLSPMAIAVLVLVPLAAYEAVGPLPAAVTALTQASIAAERIVELLDSSGTAAPSAGAELPANFELRLAAVRAGWPGSPATEPVSLNLPIGSRTAIVGASGSGKTSLLMTIAGLLPPVSGVVTCAGTSLAAWQQDDVRRRVTYFAEDAHLFETTVLENLRVARGDLTAEEASSALVAVGLGDWLESLADGVDTVLTGGVRAVSGGQRRRLLLARALVSPADVLLLDEPTEHLDDADGARILRALLSRRGGLVAPSRTVVVVTHRLPEDNAADQVVHVGSAGGENTLPSGANAITFVGTRGRRWSEVEEFQDA